MFKSPKAPYGLYLNSLYKTIINLVLVNLNIYIYTNIYYQNKVLIKKSVQTLHLFFPSLCLTCLLLKVFSLVQFIILFTKLIHLLTYKIKQLLFIRL